MNTNKDASAPGDQPGAGQTEAPSIEGLQSELAAEKAAHLATRQTLEGEVAAHKAAHATTKDALDVLSESHADSTDALGQAAEIIEGQTQTIADLEETVRSLQTAPPEFPVITVGKAKYAVEVKTFGYNGQHYTLEQLVADKALQAELVKKGVGFLVKQG